MRGWILRGLTVLLLTLLLLSSVGCYRSISPSEEDLKVVGTVGDFEVYYDELFHTVMITKDEMKSSYGEDCFTRDPGYYAVELKDRVYRNLLSSYAILSIASGLGHSIEEAERMYAEEIEADMAELCASAGGMHAYKKMLHENYMTDRFIRYYQALLILQDSAFEEYVNWQGLISSDAEEICSIILKGNTYAATRHIAVFKDNGKTDEENRALIESLYTRVTAGGEVFDTLVSAYNEDTAQTENGYYFMHGEMQKEYEEAAFALSVDEYAVAETDVGFYLIRRIKKDREYVMMNCYGSGSALFDSYQRYTFLSYLDEAEAELAFTPNEYGASLDLVSIEQKPFFDFAYLIHIVGVVMVCMIPVGLIVWWCVASVRADREELMKRKRRRG